MLNEAQIKELEWKLSDLAGDYYDSRNRENKERFRGYCQGMAYVLSKIGYSVEWDNGKATVVKDD